MTPRTPEGYQGVTFSRSPMARLKERQRAQAFVSKKIKKLRKEGYPRQQAIAIALDQARQKGYNVARMEHTK